MRQDPKKFEKWENAIEFVMSRLTIPIARWMDAGPLLRHTMTQRKITDLNVGAQIALRRENASLTQTELAALIGIDAENLARYESGRARIDAALLLDIGRCLDVPISWFFDYAGSQPLQQLGMNAATEQSIENANDKEQTQLLVHYFSNTSDVHKRHLLLDLARALSDAGSVLNTNPEPPLRSA